MKLEIMHKYLILIIRLATELLPSTSTMLIRPEAADQLSTTAFLVFDNADLPRVRSEFDRGNKISQYHGRANWKRDTAQSTTKGGTGCNSRLFYRWLMITDLTTEKEYP